VVLLRARGCGSESRQLENDPRAAIQLREVQKQGRPFGGHFDFGTGSDVGAGDGVLLAVAAEHDGRLSRSSTTESAGTGRGPARPAGPRRGPTTAHRAGRTPPGRTPRRAPPGTAGSSGTCAPSATESGSAGAVKGETPDIALAHGCVPRGLDYTGL